ncbi:hypothetical protein AVEN_33380-1 [Araneus ventricosus]|uniref:Uncharacterized protein n=1 Tax=Araneus ventricosus TaxID=182803 RepID=A0A4Y2WST9_ARAVE|nr:hypothetical protein AVEN_33380-1 [Araneus ventricosus]
MGVAPDFPLELVQQFFFSFASNLGIVMQEDDTITQHGKAFSSEGLRWPSDYFLFPKLKEHLSGTRFSSDSDAKTAAENWRNGKGCDFYQAGLNKLVLRSDNCLNRFSHYLEK